MKTSHIGIAVLILGLMGQPLAFGESWEEKVPTRADETADVSHLANVLTVVNVPTRGVLCGLTSVMASIFMAASGGTRYVDAADMMREGCSGPWTITPQMLDGRAEGQMSLEASFAKPSLFTDEPAHFHRVPNRVPGGRKAPAVANAPISGRGTSKEGVVEQTITVGGRATRVVEPERLIFPEIAFKFDSTELTDLGKGQVYLAAEKLKEKAELVLVIEGYADHVGTEEYNRKLGLHRAERVIKELTDLGIDPARVSAVSFGESKPLIDLDSDWARAINRRVEFKIRAP